VVSDEYNGVVDGPTSKNGTQKSSRALNHKGMPNASAFGHIRWSVLVLV